MTIKQNLVPTSKYSLKCPNPMTPIGICVHNTANDASALNESNYLVNNPDSGEMSYHFVVDDKEVYQMLPLDRNGWHAGDGVNGVGNRKYIGIEICYSKSGGAKFTKAEDNATIFIAKLLKERGWGIGAVKKHQDFSSKYCPHRTLDLGWQRFLDKVEEQLQAGEPSESEDLQECLKLHKQLVDEIDKILKPKIPNLSSCLMSRKEPSKHLKSLEIRL